MCLAAHLQYNASAFRMSWIAAILLRWQILDITVFSGKDALSFLASPPPSLIVSDWFWCWHPFIQWALMGRLGLGIFEAGTIPASLAWHFKAWTVQQNCLPRGQSSHTCHTDLRIGAKPGTRLEEQLKSVVLEWQEHRNNGNRNRSPASLGHIHPGSLQLFTDVTLSVQFS